MSKENKDYKAVGKFYDKEQESEFLMCHRLNENLPLSLKRNGYFFMVNTGNQYNTHDLVLVKILPSRQVEIIVKIEYEIGAKQIEWDELLPRDSWQALNLSTRKKYGENFDLFIKSSLTLNSLFAIDCRGNFVQNLVGKNPETLKHNLGFETDDQFYRIYWEDVDKNLYVDNKEKKILNNNNICISENDSQWKIFYSFLWRRFINPK